MYLPHPRPHLPNRAMKTVNMKAASSGPRLLTPHCPLFGLSGSTRHAVHSKCRSHNHSAPRQRVSRSMISSSVPRGSKDPRDYPLAHPFWDGCAWVERHRLRKAGADNINIRTTHFSYPPPESGIPEVREELEKKQWGLVIYRTAYGGSTDQQFSKLLELIDAQLHESLAKPDQQELLTSMDWPVVEDEELDCVVTEVVRERFAQWALDRGVRRQFPYDDERVPMSKDGRVVDGWEYEVGRFHYCLFADRRSLESADWKDEYGHRQPFIAALYLDWLPPWHPKLQSDMSGQDLLTPIEGNPYEDVGWFYIPLSSLVEYYNDMCENGLWGEPWLPAGRPPSVAQDYTLGIKRPVLEWRGDTVEGHHKRPRTFKLRY